MLKLKSHQSFKVYLVKLLIGVAKNWAILQKTHLEACYTPKFHYKRQSDAILIKFWHWNHIKITFIFQVLLVTCPKFDYSAGRDFNFGQTSSIFIFLGLFGQCLIVPNWATWYLKICKVVCSLLFSNVADSQSLNFGNQMSIGIGQSHKTCEFIYYELLTRSIGIGQSHKIGQTHKLDKLTECVNSCMNF